LNFSNPLFDSSIISSIVVNVPNLTTLVIYRAFAVNSINPLRECRLEVREDNAAALNLYQKLGYKKVGKLEKYYGEAHGLYLQKTLH
jgi:ribosomal protein S18 acetylase RimI-like enzyme